MTSRKKIGKPDPEIYVDSGKWKARQGGNGLLSANDVKLRFTNCTAEEHAKIYRLTRPYDGELVNLFVPFGKVASELGRKILHETLILEIFSAAKIYGATTLVDMAQTAGLVELNVGLETIDFAVFAGHKSLFAPTGIAGFVMNPSMRFKLKRRQNFSRQKKIGIVSCWSCLPIMISLALSGTLRAEITSELFRAWSKA